MPAQYDAQDTPWKEILERFFPQFMQFFFPQTYLDINWKRRYAFLDKELQQVIRDAELGKRLVDKLVKVWLKDGKEIWVLIHIEIQGKKDKTFAERIYIYNYRLYDRYHHKVASFAVLTDNNRQWRPSEFVYQLWDCEVKLKFSIAKLLDYKSQQASLAQSKNPFALIVMAHLQMLATKKNKVQRLDYKLILAKQLYKQGYNKEEIIGLYKFIDWIMVLPAELEQQFLQTITTYEEEMKMPYISSAERFGIQKGLEQGLKQGLEQGERIVVERLLKKRLGELDASVMDKLKRLTVKKLEELAEVLLDFQNKADLEHWLDNSLAT